MHPVSTQLTMKFIRRAALIAAMIPSCLVAQHDSLPQVTRELRQRHEELDGFTKKQPFDFSAYEKALERNRDRVAQLIARDSLRSASDFLLASTLAQDPGGFYENRRVEHELALMALVLGDTATVRRVSLTWDGLNWSLGRGQRLGSYKRDGVPTNMDPVPAPAVVRDFFSDPLAARKRATGRANNAELQQLRDADQADRTDPIDEAKMASMRTNDPIRRERVMKLIADGVPATGRDFHNAALVLQHGQSPDAYRLAHELSIVAVALGDSEAAWLVSRTYDRMLFNMGHRQRFGTQYRGDKVLPMDETAVNDRMRLALKSRKLAEMKR